MENGDVNAMELKNFVQNHMESRMDSLSRNETQEKPKSSEQSSGIEFKEKNPQNGENDAVANIKPGSDGLENLNRHLASQLEKTVQSLKDQPKDEMLKNGTKPLCTNL